MEARFIKSGRLIKSKAAELFVRLGLAVDVNSVASAKVQKEEVKVDETPIEDALPKVRSPKNELTPKRMVVKKAAKRGRKPNKK